MADVTRHEELQEVVRKIEEGLGSARRGDLLDGEAVIAELKAMAARRSSDTRP